MKLKNLLDLMWKVSINSNWTKGARWGPREFAKVTISNLKMGICVLHMFSRKFPTYIKYFEDFKYKLLIDF